MSKNFKIRRTLEEVRKFGVSAAALTRLSLFLNRLVDGNMDAPGLVSATAERRGSDRIFRDFEVIFESAKPVLNDNLLEIELNQKSKYGPRSIAQPWVDIKERTLATFDESTILQLPKALSVPADRQHRLRPFSLQKVINLIKNQTNSGLKDMVPKGDIKDKYLNESFLLEEVSEQLPAVPFIRTQEMLKTRVVWGFPIAQVIYEGTLFYPLLEYSKNIKWLKALVSPEAVDEFVVNQVTNCNKSGGTLLSIDFSNYDTSVKKELQGLAFHYFRSLFQRSEDSKFDLIEDRFSRISLVTPDGIVEGNHGIPSGSAFTNIVGSTVQATIALDSGSINEDEFQVLGDDGVYCLKDENSADELIGKFEACGLNVNVDKSHRSGEYCVYLQKLYDVYYIERGVSGGIYPVWRALNRIVHPERFINFGQFDLNGKDYFSIRTISILENCKYHPMFEDLVKFVMSLDKYNLQFSAESLTKFVEMTEKREGSAGVLRNQYGDNLKGIRNFESYKLIKRIASGGVKPNGGV